MTTFYFLQSCDTCKRILKELDLPKNTILREIKTQPITTQELDQLYKHTGSYQALFNKRARKYKELGLKDTPLEELDYKNYILEEYTFLKRPVLVLDNEIFVGNSKKTIAQAKERLHE